MRHFPFTFRTLACTALLVAGSQLAWAQSNLGIGTAAPDASALVEMQSANKGALLPRLALQSLSDAATVAAPAAALLVFNTNAALPGGKGFYYNAGTPGAPTWTRLNTGAAGAGDNLGNHTATQALNLGANALVGSSFSIGSVVGLGVRADGGLNIGENTVGNNIYMGYQTGLSNTSGTGNLFLGHNSGVANGLGISNLFLGNLSGRFNTSGDNNLFLGYQSGYSNQTGDNNVFLGYQSGYNSTGHRNLFIGTESGFNTTSGDNLFMGYGSGRANLTGSGNVFVGNESGVNNTTGGENLFVGRLSGAGNTGGTKNWAVGNFASFLSNNLTNAGALGYNARVNQSNSLVLGGTGTDAVKVGIGTTAPRGILDVAGPGNTYLVANPEDGGGQTVLLPSNITLAPALTQGHVGNDVTIRASRASGLGTSNIMFKTTTANIFPLQPGTVNEMLWLRGWDNKAVFYCEVTAPTFTTLSDQRLKQDIRPLGGALAAVQALRGVRYTFRQDIAGRKLPTGEQVGFLAQELEKLYPELVSTGPDGYKAVNYNQLTPVLLEAIKEQQAQIEALKTQATASASAQTQAAARADRAEAATASFGQRLQALEAAAPAGPAGRTTARR